MHLNNYSRFCSYQTVSRSDESLCSCSAELHLLLLCFKEANNKSQNRAFKNSFLIEGGETFTFMARVFFFFNVGIEREIFFFYCMNLVTVCFYCRFDMVSMF